MYYTADVNLTSNDIYPENNDWSLNVFLDAKTGLQKIIPFYCIIFAPGIIGNGLVIWIAGFRMKKTISAVWFLNLAIADFLCCASLPLRIAEWTITFSSPLNREITCSLNIIMFNLNMSASVLLLVAMSIDRCVSVMSPFWAKVHRTRKLVIITAAIIWVMSVIYTGLMCCFYFIYIVEVNEWCMYYGGYDDDHVQKIKLTIRLFRLVMMFVIPFLIILISYVFIFIKIRTSKRSQRSQRPYRIITAVIMCFFICWSPYYIWPLIPIDNEHYFSTFITFHTINTLIVILAYLNSCLNPIIYVLMGQDVKLCFFRSIPPV